MLSQLILILYSKRLETNVVNLHFGVTAVVFAEGPYFLFFFNVTLLVISLT